MYLQLEYYGSDRLNFYDGPDTRSKLIKAFSGTYNTGYNITSTAQYLTAYFRSSSSYSNSGGYHFTYWMSGKCNGANRPCVVQFPGENFAMLHSILISEQH